MARKFQYYKEFQVVRILAIARNFLSCKEFQDLETSYNTFESSRIVQ